MMKEIIINTGFWVWSIRISTEVMVTFVSKGCHHMGQVHASPAQFGSHGIRLGVNQDFLPDPEYAQGHSISNTASS